MHHSLQSHSTPALANWTKDDFRILEVLQSSFLDERPQLPVSQPNTARVWKGQKATPAKGYPGYLQGLLVAQYLSNRQPRTPIWWKVYWIILLTATQITAQLLSSSGLLQSWYLSHFVSLNAGTSGESEGKRRECELWARKCAIVSMQPSVCCQLLVLLFTNTW